MIELSISVFWVRCIIRTSAWCSYIYDDLVYHRVRVRFVTSTLSHRIETQIVFTTHLIRICR